MSELLLRRLRASRVLQQAVIENDINEFKYEKKTSNVQ